MKTPIQNISNLNIIARPWGIPICTLAAIFISLLWPGDTSWINYDQAVLVDQSLRANASLRLSSYYHSGFVVQLHPLIIWILQLFFFITHDVAKIIFIKQLLILSACLAGLCYLAKSLGYTKYIILLYCASMFHYTFGRALVDSSIAILLSLFLFVSFTWFFLSKSYISVICWLLFVIAMLHIHPSGAIAVIPFFIILFLLDYQWVKTHWLGFGILLGLSFLLCMPYWQDVLRQLFLRQAMGTYSSPRGSFSLNALETAITGGLWYSYDFLQLIPDSYFKQYGIPPLIARSLTLITMTSYLLLVLGIALTLFGLLKRFRRSEAFLLEDRLGSMALLIILLYSGVTYVFHEYRSVHHFSGFWFCIFYFIWRSTTAMEPYKLIKYIPRVYVLAMTTAWIGCVFVQHHINNETMTSVNSMSDIAKKIAQYSPESDIIISVDLLGEAAKGIGYIIAHSDNAVLGFYYRNHMLCLKSIIEKIPPNNIIFFKNACLFRKAKSKFVPSG